jgi:glycosyltransferase involved in cell wall biosynthesis
MAAYNAEQYVAEALQSICDQTFRDVEVILVDDGSKDGTVRAAEQFRRRLDLTIIVQQNAGPSAARNTGIRRARGRYCAFLDADDVMLPELLDTLVRLLDADPEVGFALTDIVTFDAGGTIRDGHWKLADAAREDPLERLVMENFVTTSAVMGRTNCLIEAGLFPENRRVAEDYELWLRLAARWKVASTARSLVRYRYTSGSLSSDKRYSSRCALEVIEAFWRDHAAYAAGHTTLRRRSLARHLTNAAGAAAMQGERREAFVYVVRALTHFPFDAISWKWLLKTLVQPTQHMRRRRRPAGTVRAVS